LWAEREKKEKRSQKYVTARRIRAIENGQGNTISDYEQILETWRDYCSKLYKQEQMVDPSLVHKNLNQIEKEPEIMQTEMLNTSLY